MTDGMMATENRVHEGSLIVISGFSGVGKGTVVSRLLELHDEYKLSVSCTTRKPRPGEVHGKHYFFVSKEAFLAMQESGQLLESACFCQNYYGTPKSFVQQQMHEGKSIILEIEIQGAMKIKEQFPEAVLIFIMPPSIDELISRIFNRGSETAEAIHERIERAREEAEGIHLYDYVFVNDVAEDCADRIHQLISVLEARTEKNRSFIREIKTQIDHYFDQKELSTGKGDN